MNIRTFGGAAMIAVALSATPAWADHGGVRGPGPGPGRAPGYAYNQVHGGHYFWGPFGFLLGTALLYSALQPRTVYYEPQVVYSPPVYYTPPIVVQSYALPGDQIIGPTYVVPQTSALPPPPSAVASSNVQPGPGASGAQWWYACKKPAGYYPYIKECPSGWEKVPQTPADAPPN